MLRGARRYALTADASGQRRISLTANAHSLVPTGMGSSGPQNITGTQSPGRTSSRANNKQNFERYEEDLLENFIQYQTDTFTRKIQNDMADMDPIICSALDISSTLPYSNFELSGTSSKERRSKYTASVNAMQIRSMLPKISRELKVEGKHISSMNFDDTDKRFTSIIPYSPDWCTVNPIPVFGRDPLIDVKYPDYIQKLLNTTDEDMKLELSEYAEDLLTMLKEGKTRLDPKYTLYLARTPYTWSPYGISMLRRLIPIWLFEKALAKGTIDLAGRRQKSILHIIAGDESWLPTNQQLQDISKLFIDADNDPIGAIVATRPGIDTQEVRDSGNSWSWTESYDTLTQIKLKGMGYSDAIFSEFSVQTAEQTINATLEGMQSERDELTQRVFYNKMFLTIAVENDFKKTKKDIEITGSDEQKELLKQIRAYREESDYISKYSQHVMLSSDREAIDPEEYDLPSIRYEKNLKVASNDALFNNLGTLAERGFPAPLRVQSAALGVPFQDMLDGLEQDVKDREFVAAYQKRLPQTAAQDGEEEGGDGNMFMESMDFKRKGKTWRELIGSNRSARTDRHSMDKVVHKDTLTGKELSRKGRNVRMDKENNIIMEAASRIREHEQAVEKASRRTNNKSYSYKKS